MGIVSSVQHLWKYAKSGKIGSCSSDCSLWRCLKILPMLMAKHAEPGIPDTPEEWLDDFNTFSIYQVLPKIIELWGLNVRMDAEAKKTSCNRPSDDNTAVPAKVCAVGNFY